jgi:hypothetical protein
VQEIGRVIPLHFDYNVEGKGDLLARIKGQIPQSVKWEVEGGSAASFYQFQEKYVFFLKLLFLSRKSQIFILLQQKSYFTGYTHSRTEFFSFPIARSLSFEFELTPELGLYDIPLKHERSEVKSGSGRASWAGAFLFDSSKQKKVVLKNARFHPTVISTSRDIHTS